MLKILQRRNFALLWCGQLISIAGDWAVLIALPFYVYVLTGSTLATGSMFIIETLPRVLIGSVAGVFVDRCDYRRTMIVSDLLRAALLSPLFVVHSAHDLWIVYLVALAQATVSQFFVPAESALLPCLVSAESLVTANSLNSLGQQIARLLAPPLGGALMASLGFYSVVWFDSGSFLLSAILITLIILPPKQKAIAGNAQDLLSVSSSIWRDWQAGLVVVWHDSLINILFATTAICMVGEGILTVLLTPFVREILQGDAVTLGWMMSAQAVGSLLGASLIGSFGQRISSIHLIVFGALGWGLIDLAIFNTTVLLLTLTLFVVVGVPLIGLHVTINALLQQTSTDQYRGRIFGALGTLNALMMLIGMIIGGFGGDWFSIRLTLDLACGLFVIAGLTAWIRLAGSSNKNALIAF